MQQSFSAELSTGFRSLFPAGVVAAELRRPGDIALLLPAEAACLGRSVAKRQQEFAAGRLCARRALAELGITDFALLAASDRLPVWPASIVGSITHTSGLCAAVAAPRSLFQALGVDSEIAGNVGAELWPKICVPAELAWIESQPPERRASAAALVFAAKEALYKSQYPLTREWLGFEDLTLTPAGFDQAVAEGAIGTFRIEPTRRIALAALKDMPLTGRYRFHGQFVSAGVAVEN
jgi:4'-phosphopantetheinyl transferase EntD